METHTTSTTKHHRSHIPNDELANEFRAVLNSIGDGVIVVNTHGEIIICNPVAEEMLGVRADDVKGKKLGAVVHVQTETGERTEVVIAQVLQTMQRHSVCQHLFLVRNGSEVLPLTYCASPICNHDGQARGVVITFRDASREYEMNKMKTEFVSVVSHQLRTPLTSVKWFLETLLEKHSSDTLSEAQRDYVEQAFQSNERMITLVDDLLNLSRLESGTVAIVIEPVDMLEVCKSVIGEMELFAHANNVEIDCRLDQQVLPKVQADRTVVRQVLRNVLSNAVKYTKNHQTVTLDVQLQGTEAIFTMKDHGIGIPTVDQHRVFEPFFRAQNAIATRAEGSGLGLYSSKLLLERCHGRIWLHSQEGHGTEVSIALPIIPQS